MSDKSNRIYNTKLNQIYKFNNFVVGKSNEFAYKAMQEISEINIINNIFVIYGNIGVGKTHLMQAVGNVFQKQGKDVIYTTVEHFLNDFISHVRDMTMDNFQEKYRKCDLLLIDDIQFLANKEGIQEELYHTIETLKSNSKQIIFTSSKHPSKINGLSENLKSHYASALVVKINAPELKTKNTIIENKSNYLELVLDKETIEFIAKKCTDDINTVEGIILKLKAYSSIYKKNINLKIAKKVLKIWHTKHISIKIN